MFKFIKEQLKFDPFDYKRKRITTYNSERNGYCLAYRTWRIIFYKNIEKRLICVERIFSGYSKSDMKINVDKYNDKQMHKSYNLCYPEHIVLNIK